MMNLSDLMTSIKMDLGIYGLALPFKEGDKVLFDVLKLKTNKMFSIFCPYKLQVMLNLHDLKCIRQDYVESIYLLPQGLFGDRKLLYVDNVTPKQNLLGSGYINPIFDGSVEMYNSLILTQANANLISMAAPPITFKYIKPNRVHLYNTATIYGEMYFDLAYEHSDNLQTIPDTAYDSFYDLAVLDEKCFLYNTLKHYNNIQTAFGEISMHIDDWADAAGERKDLLEHWRDTYHEDGNQFWII